MNNEGWLNLTDLSKGDYCSLAIKLEFEGVRKLEVFGVSQL